MTAAEPSQTRRAAIAATLGLAIVSTIATSPAVPSSTVRAAANGNVELDGSAPVVVVPLTIEASDEALWSNDPEIAIRSSTITIAIRSAWLEEAADPQGRQPQPPTAGTTTSPAATTASPPATTTRPPPPTTLTVFATGIDDALTGADDTSTRTTFELQEVCPYERDCRLELSLVIELATDVEPAPVSTHWLASGEIVIRGSEHPPTDARLTMTAGEISRAAKIIDASTEEERIRIDASHPLALRRIYLRLPEDALPADRGRQILSRGRFTTTIAIDEAVAGVGRARAGPVVRVSLIPDDRGGEAIQDRPAGSSHPFDPFAACERGVACEVSFTARFEWISADEAIGAEVGWRVTAGLLAFDEPGPPAGAGAEIEVEDLGTAGPEDARLTAQASGTLRLEPGATSLGGGLPLRVRLSPEAAPSGDFGSAAPAIHVVFRARAIAAEPTASTAPPTAAPGAAATAQATTAPGAAGATAPPTQPSPSPVEIPWSFLPTDVLATRGVPPGPMLAGEPTEIRLILPATCRPGAACEQLVRVTFRTFDPRLVDAATPIAIEWTAEATLVYPNRPAPPTGASIEIADGG